MREKGSFTSWGQIKKGAAVFAAPFDSIYIFRTLGRPVFHEFVYIHRTSGRPFFPYTLAM